MVPALAALIGGSPQKLTNSTQIPILVHTGLTNIFPQKIEIRGAYTGYLLKHKGFLFNTGFYAKGELQVDYIYSYPK